MATSRAAKAFVHKSGEVGFSKYLHVVYHIWLWHDWAAWLCRQALSWGLLYRTMEFHLCWEAWGLTVKQRKINLPPLKPGKQEEQFQFRKDLILCLWVKNGWEWGIWIAMASANCLSPAWLSVRPGRWVFERQANAIVRFPYFNRGAKNSLRRGRGEKSRNCLATPYPLLVLHSPLQ